MQKLSVKGTPLYIAPELIDQTYANSNIDIFSLGCVIYQLAYAGDHPFYKENKNFKN